MAYRFATCMLDPARQELWRDGERVHVEPQVFALLETLLQAGGATVAKDDLVDKVWNGLAVSESTISARINAARKAVGDSGKAQQVIQTVHKRGFRLVADLADDTPPDTAAECQPQAAPLAVRFTTSADGATIAHAQSGQGPPLMRVSHWLSHLELDWESPVWRPFLTTLGEGFTVHRYDQRGTGLSTRSLARTDLDAFVDDLLAVSDANGLDRFPIFAASQAAPVAIRFAALYPERVSHLVLYGGYAVGRKFRDPAPGNVDEETILGLIRAGWGQPNSAFFSAFTTLFMPDATPEQSASFARIQSESIAADSAARLRQAVDAFQVTDDLPKVRAPTLVLHASGDAIHPIEQGRMIAAAMPDARFMMLDSRNHVPLPQEPCWRKLMDAVKSFCAH